MIRDLKTSLSRNLTNSRGWRTNRKIVVIESDDWGSIRMPDKKTFDSLAQKGFTVNKCAYLMNDTLENNDDLSILFDFLENRKKAPVITANFLTANPNFKKIEASNFEQYFPESLEETLAQYPNHDNVKTLWLKGSQNKYFRPQLHGREHLNISQWMSDLKRGNQETIEAFHHKMFGITSSIVKVKRKSYQEAFGLKNKNFDVGYNEILTDAYKDFEKLFGFKSKTFIAPNYSWNEEVEQITAKLGITHLQGTSTQRVPDSKLNRLVLKKNYLGKKNKYDQKYLIRNVSFEPFTNQNVDWVSKALIEIKNAFLWHKPVIISMHRVNFVGGINPLNRETNLTKFNELLNRIDKIWPEVEYLSSDELAKLI